MRISLLIKYKEYRPVIKKMGKLGCFFVGLFFLFLERAVNKRESKNGQRGKSAHFAVPVLVFRVK
jgi:hypothetical protein